MAYMFQFIKEDLLELEGNHFFLEVPGRWI